MRFVSYGPALLVLCASLVGCQERPSPACSDMASCDSSLDLGTTSFEQRDDGRLNATAEQAWPKRPPSPAALTPEEIAEACVKLASCVQPSGISEADLPLAQAEYLATCLAVNPYEERAIPYGSDYYFGTAATDFLPAGRQASERWTFFVRAVIASDGECAHLDDILTPRPDEITCSEAGCWWYSTQLPIPQVTCEGDVAVLETGGEVYRRDCSRAFLSCDPTSATGCADRPPASCRPGAADVCDGDIKLGCDHYGRLTFRDCGWVEGGHCVEEESGAECRYDAPEQCTSESTLCDGDALTVCVAGRSVTVNCQDVGQQTCVQVQGQGICM